MGDVRFRLATEADCAALAPLLRAEDAAECEAGGLTPLEALRQSLALSSVAYALELGGELAALCGVAPAGGTLLGGPEAGIAWALTSEVVERRKRDFIRASRAALKILEREAPVLINDVDSRYSAALRWARWLGFSVGEPRPLGPRGLPFCRIARRSPWAT